MSCLCEFCIDRNRVFDCLVGLVGAKRGGGVKYYWKTLAGWFGDSIHSAVSV